MRRTNKAISFFFSFIIGFTIGTNGQPFTNGWAGEDVLPTDTFLNASRWSEWGLSDPIRDSVKVSANDSSLEIHWYLASGERPKHAQRYIVLSQPINLISKDIFGIDIRGTPCRPNKRFMLKFEDSRSPSRQVSKIWKGLPSISRWCENISVLKKELGTTDFSWDSVRIISLEINAETSNDTAADSGTVFIKRLICASTNAWVRASSLDTLAHTINCNNIAKSAAKAIISRQVPNGLLLTWKEDSTSYLYGQGLALKILAIEGIWENSAPMNPAASAAEKLAMFLKSHQASAGYWPRCWASDSGTIKQNLENDSTVWFGDFPWIITGLESYYKKSNDIRADSAIKKALNFLNPLIEANGKVNTYDFKNNNSVAVTSFEAYAAVINCLYEIGDSLKAKTALDYAVSNSWDNDLNYFKEGAYSSRTVLFANTWLSPLMYRNGDHEKAIKALSFVGKVLYTKGSGTPYGFDGIGPFATWYEGTLSYISAGGPNSPAIFESISHFINPDSTVPHYNDSIDGEIWARKWSSLDGTSWLYYAASGISPFSIITLPSAPILLSPANESVDISQNPTLLWKKASGVLCYRVQVSKDSIFSDIIISDSTCTDTSKSIGPLDTNTAYYWRVNAKNTSGIGPWSERRKFRTSPPEHPTAPELISPKNDSINLPFDVTFVWERSVRAVKYCIQVSKDSLFSSSTINDSILSDTSVMIQSLDINATYFWRVSAENSGGVDTSVIWKFRTQPSVSVLPKKYNFSMNELMKCKGIIMYALPKKSFVSLRIYNIQGKIVLSLVRSIQPAGYHKVKLPTECISFGNYILEFKAGAYHVSKRVNVFR